MKRIALLATLVVLLGVGSAEGRTMIDAQRHQDKLTTSDAVFLMRDALLRQPKFSFAAGYSRHVRCNKRLSRIRVKCRVGWIVGDMRYWGRGTIWFTFENHAAGSNYAYRITRFNEYCGIVLERDDCTRTFVVR